MNKKRLSLIILLSYGLLYKSEIRNYYFIPILFFINSLVVFSNFPNLILISNRRPMYVEDLFVLERNEILLNLTAEQRQQYENRMNYMLILSNALFVSALADYWWYEFGGVRNESYVGIFGITGGIIKMFQIVNHASGTALLLLTRTAIVKTHELQDNVEYI